MSGRSQLLHSAEVLSLQNFSVSLAIVLNFLSGVWIYSAVGVSAWVLIAKLQFNNATRTPWIKNCRDEELAKLYRYNQSLYFGSNITGNCGNISHLLMYCCKCSCIFDYRVPNNLWCSLWFPLYHHRLPDRSQFDWYLFMPSAFVVYLYYDKMIGNSAIITVFSLIRSFLSECYSIPDRNCSNYRSIEYVWYHLSCDWSTDYFNG